MRELRLGLTQAAILIGVICGCLVCAFAVGYVSGQKVGFENALNSSVAALPRYPIETAKDKELQVADVKEVYAKLEAKPVDDLPEEELKVKDSDLPKIGAVQAVTSNPLMDDLVVDLLEETSANESELLGDIKPGTAVGSVDKLNDVGSLQGLADSILKETEQQKIAEEAQQPVPTISIPSPSPAKAIEQAQEGFLKAKIQPGWYVQIAAPESLSEANDLAMKFRNSGFPVSIEKTNVRNQIYYRILVGPEDNRAQGDRLLEQVKREKFIVGQPFLRMAR